MATWEAVGKRTVSPFQTLGSTVDYAIEKAEATDEGSTLEVFTAMLMSALMVEALLNHVGAELFAPGGKPTALWNTIERSRPEEKLQTICERIQFKPDFSQPPFEHFRVMFRFRNMVSHGKTEVVRGRATYDSDNPFSIDRAPEFMPAWERECTIENARRYDAAASEIATILCRESGVPYPITHGSWSAVATADDPLEAGTLASTNTPPNQ